jgi:hypothetical protein
MANELDKKFAERFGLPEQDWTSDKIKIPFESLKLTEAQKTKAMSEAVGYASDKFYKGQNQDPYLYYFLMLSTPNAVIMAALLNT